VPAGPPLPTVEDWAEQIAYLVGLIGADHAGLGLDLMAGGNWLRDFDATSYPRLTEALVAQGLDAATVVKILGENWLRILDSARVD
jgi:membrane dipeptidase